MFLTLLLVTFLVATSISAIVAFLFKKPAGQILNRIIADEVSAAWRRYLMFAIYVVGVSSGVNIGDLQKYITAPAVKGSQVIELTNERWVLEVYRTVIGSLQGLAWALLVFFICALMAFIIVRHGETTKSKSDSKAV